MRKPATIKAKGPMHITHADMANWSGSHGWGQGRAAGWKVTRLRILKRDGGLCQCHECKTQGRYEIARTWSITSTTGAGQAMRTTATLHQLVCGKAKRKTELEVLIGLALGQASCVDG